MGFFVGALVRVFVGEDTGALVGAFVGAFVGALVGLLDGAFVGEATGVGGGFTGATGPSVFASQNSGTPKG